MSVNLFARRGSRVMPKKEKKMSGRQRTYVINGRKMPSIE